MKALRKLSTWLGMDLKQSDGFIPQAAAYESIYLPRTHYPYRLDIRTGLDSNVIMAPVNWIMRNFTEADAVVQVKRDGRWEVSEDHPLELAIARPNPFYSDDLLWKATILSYALDGNAYWQKIRNSFGEILGYWYIPHFLIEPKFPFDGSEFISYYEYRPNPGIQPIRLPVRDVVHYRFGLDPRNPRLGMSPLKPLLREVFTDEEASNFSATILRNMGVPGGKISPKDASALPKPADVEAMKQYMKGFSGDSRGEWLVLGVPTDVQQFGFDPNNLQLTGLRDIAEERVCAVLGIPAAVVGFGSGLQSTKVGATMKELRKAAWDNCVTPMQNSIADQGTMQLLPDFVSQLRRFRMRFDRSEFAASQEEETEKAQRAALLVEKGVLRVDRAQEMLGLEVDPSRAVYLGPAPAPEEAEGATPPTGAQDDDEMLQAVAARLNGGNGRSTANAE